MPLPMPPVPMKPIVFMPRTSSNLGASGLRCRGIDHEISAIALDHNAVVALGGFRRKLPLAHVVEHALGLALQRVAVAAAARRIEPEDVALLQRIIGVAGRQALRVRTVRIDPDVAGPSGVAAGAAVRR